MTQPRRSLDEITRDIMDARGCDWHEARRIMGRAGARKRAARRPHQQAVKQQIVDEYQARLERMGLK